MENEKLNDTYLNQFVFYGLKDINDGFDADTIFYFSESEFLLVHDRV